MKREGLVLFSDLVQFFKDFLVHESEVIEALVGALCTSTAVIGEMLCWM